MGDTIDLKETAALLDVHYQTAYRWVREGKLPATRVRNRYELDVAAVEAFAAERDTPAEPRPPRTRRRWDELADGFRRDLLDGDVARILATVDRLSGQGESALELCTRLFVPALVAIGAGWRAGEVSIAQEHRASAIVTQALAAIEAPRPGRPLGTAVVVAPSGDRHELPTAMAAAVLKADGWKVQRLGADLPAEALADFLDSSEGEADLVVVTVTTPDAGGAAAEMTEVCRDRDIRVIVGGPGKTLDDLVVRARRPASR